MNDSTSYSYQEASAKRKKRNQFISILIIVAVVLAVVVGWGIREFNKAQDAERIKNALNSQVEPAFSTSSGGNEAGALVDSSAMEIQDSPDVAQSPEVRHEATPMPQESPKVEPKPEAIQPPKPVATKPVTPKPVAAKPPKKISVEKSVAPAKPVQKVEKPSTPRPPESQLAMVTPKPEATAQPPKPVETVVQPPVKAFAPEDLPMPTTVEPSEEGVAAVSTLPTKVESMENSVVSGGSEHFKTGLSAYKQADYVNAIRAFAALSKPASRKRGNQERDEYVQGNFLRGVALLKMQHISEAASAFQNALEYEKYYPLANMNLGICYIELKQYAKAHKCFESVLRDQNFIEPAMFDDVMQRTKYFWALAWTRLCKTAKDPDRINYYRQQAILRWKDYQVWFGKNDKYKSENQKADNYLKSLSLN